jgi:serine/threonine protein kinase
MSMSKKVYRDFFLTMFLSVIYLVMEYCEEGDVFKRIEKKIPSTDMVFFFFVINVFSHD